MRSEFDWSSIDQTAEKAVHIMDSELGSLRRVLFKMSFLLPEAEKPVHIRLNLSIP